MKLALKWSTLVIPMDLLNEVKVESTTKNNILFLDNLIPNGGQGMEQANLQFLL